MITKTKVISFISGKGGVGKTSLVVNMGKLAAERGLKTLMIDGDFSLGKLGIALGVRPQWTLEKVIEGVVDLESAIQPVSENLFLLASPNGVLGFDNLSETVRNQLFYAMDSLAGQYDLILLDHASGLSPDVTAISAAAHHHVVVTTCEPTSYTDAYAIMKVLNHRFSVRDFSLVVTMSDSQSHTEGVIERFMGFVRSQLQVKIELIDILPRELKVSESIRSQKAFVELFPNSPLTQQLSRMSHWLEGMPMGTRTGLQFFYAQEASNF